MGQKVGQIMFTRLIQVQSWCHAESEAAHQMYPSIADLIAIDWMFTHFCDGEGFHGVVRVRLAEFIRLCEGRALLQLGV